MDRLFPLPEIDSAVLSKRTRRHRHSAQEIIDAYRRTGSVWRAGKELGIAGQVVHERLRALDYPLANRRWDESELSELRSLVGCATIGEIAHRLGRPYAGVALMISRLGIGTHYGTRRIKIPRGAGYDKASCARYIKVIDTTGVVVTTFARRNALGVETLCRSLEKHFPDWWQSYRRTHSDLPEKQCSYCTLIFVPSNSRQEYCSRKCGNDARVDRTYFGGNRRQCVGLTEGICQLCGRHVEKGLAPHHIVGKENDPGNRYLIALCPGCHHIVSLLGGRAFVDEAVGWESLIALVALRRHGTDIYSTGVYTCVDIEALEPGDDEGDEEAAS